MHTPQLVHSMHAHVRMHALCEPLVGTIEQELDAQIVVGLACTTHNARATECIECMRIGECMHCVCCLWGSPFFSPAVCFAALTLERRSFFAASGLA